VSQRSLSERVGVRQSEVSEVIRGRQVRMYDVLLRIAAGLGVERGAMGLAYDGPVPSPCVGEEVDADMERRKFLAVASATLFGHAVLGEVGALAVTGTGRETVSRIGMFDVQRVERLNRQLRSMERQFGGDTMRGVLATHALDADRLATAHASDDTRTRLHHAISHAHQLAGWASGDAGLMNHCRWHFGKALDYTKGNGERTAEILAAAGSMEKHDDNSNAALKLFQLASVATAKSEDPQIGAVLRASSASAYFKLGYEEKARACLKDARSRFADANPQASLPFFEYYGVGSGILAAAEVKMSDFDAAHTDVSRALASRPTYDVRCSALDTIVLSRLLIDAGEMAKGVTQSRRAIELVTEVGSRRVRDRLAPLQKALAGRRDSTCQDLARTIASLRKQGTSA
jgi:tetratricopeptide (TPR) repeat protein